MILGLNNLYQLNGRLIPEGETTLVKRKAVFWIQPTKAALVDYARTITDPLPQLSPHPLAHSLLNVPLPPCDPRPVLLYCPHDEVSSNGNVTCYERTEASRSVLASSPPEPEPELGSSSKPISSLSPLSQFEKVGVSNHIMYSGLYCKVV